MENTWTDWLLRRHVSIPLSPLWLTDPAAARRADDERAGRELAAVGWSGPVLRDRVTVHGSAIYRQA